MGLKPNKYDDCYCSKYDDLQLECSYLAKIVIGHTMKEKVAFVGVSFAVGLLLIGLMEYIGLLWKPYMWSATMANHELRVNLTSWVTPSLKATTANCALLFKGDRLEINKVLTARRPEDFSDNELYDKATHCSWLKKEFDTQYYVSDIEKQFPLAFALTVYNAPQQILRFLKVIYRKHNVYCIHYDRTSSKKFKRLILQMAKCLPNVIVPAVIENVIWGWHTIVDAQLNCFDGLLKAWTRYPWKYVITLCGKELPLRTNREMIQSLSKLNGTSAVYLSKNESEISSKRFMFQHVVKNGMVVRTTKRLGNIPYNLTIQKSSAYVGLTKSFTNYLLHSERAISFRKFMDHTKVPDEHFVSTLFTAPGTPGGYDAKYESLVPKISGSIWTSNEEECSGSIVHFICIANSGDLHRLHYKPKPNRRESFFYNKFFMEDDQTVIDCLEDELILRNKNEFEQDQHLGLIHNQVF